MASKNTNTFVTDDPDLNAQRQKTPSPTQQQQQQQQTGQQFGNPNVNTPPAGTQPIIRPARMGANGQQPQQNEAAQILALQQQLHRQDQELGQFRALEAARGLQPPLQLRGPPPDVDDLITRLNRACLTPAPVPAPADTPVTPKLFTTDQERTAHMLQNDTEVSRSIIHAVTSMAKATFAGRQPADLQAEQAAEFNNITELLKTHAVKIQRNEAMLGRLINPQVGKSKQTLDPPVIRAPPHDYRRHHTVMQTTILRDNIEPFEIEVPTCDIVRTWTKMKDYGMKNHFSEQDYIEAWSKVTKGEALQQFNNMVLSKYNLNQMLKFWEELYSKHRSITEQQEIIDAFIRNKSEALKAAMLRVTVIIDQMAYAEDPLAWPGVRDKQRRDVLMRIVTDNTLCFLKAQRESLENTGYLMKVDEMIHEAHNFEQLYNEVPKQPMPIHRHVPIPSNGMQIYGLNVFNQKPFWPRNNGQGQMETDQQQQQLPQQFSQPPPQQGQRQWEQKQQQGHLRGRTPDKRQFDKNRSGSKSPSRYNSGSKPASRNNSPNPSGQRTRSSSPYQKDRQQRNQSSRDQRPQHRRNSTSDASGTASGLVRGPMTSDGGTSALTLNIGDQNQYYQCNATKQCSKKHIWPKNVTPPDFCPENPSNQKN